MTFEIGPGLATVIVGVLVLLGQIWTSWRLEKVHKLVNSNYSEQKAALKAMTELAADLQVQLDQLVLKQMAR